MQTLQDFTRHSGDGSREHVRVRAYSVHAITGFAQSSRVKIHMLAVRSTVICMLVPYPRRGTCTAVTGACLGLFRQIPGARAQGSRACRSVRVGVGGARDFDSVPAEA